MRVYYDPQDDFFMRYPVVAVINNMISLGIVYVFSFENGTISQVLKKKTLVTMGSCAMYIYLLHWPVIYNVYGVINLLFPMTLVVKVFTTVLIFLVTGILSYIIWKYETKVMQHLDSHK